MVYLANALTANTLKANMLTANLPIPDVLKLSQNYFNKKIKNIMKNNVGSDKVIHFL